jgi:DNA-directed RNA polymerase subunit M/transcription elongation factor TFIIS
MLSEWFNDLDAYYMSRITPADTASASEHDECLENMRRMVGSITVYCEWCGSSNIVARQRQHRSADEESETCFECTNCGRKTSLSSSSRSAGSGF